MLLIFSSYATRKFEAGMPRLGLLPDKHGIT